MTRPRSLSLCHKLIARLEFELEQAKALIDQAHNFQNECAVMLSEKDREMMEKCKRCGRGIR